MARNFRNSTFWRQFLFCVGVVWLMFIISMTWTMYEWGSDSKSVPADDLLKAMAELERLEKQNLQLKELADHLSSMVEAFEKQGNHSTAGVQSSSQSPSVYSTLNSSMQELSIRSPSVHLNASWSPSKNYELMRRKTENDVAELWYFIGHKLRETKQACEANDRKLAVSHITSVLNMGTDMHRSIRTDLSSLYSLSDEDQWHLRESLELSRLVQSRLHVLQNPKTDCVKTRRLLCSMNKGCGYGCLLHHLAYCLIVAYGTGRTLVLDDSTFRYSPGGWNKFFLPLSKCRHNPKEISVMWSETTQESKIVVLPIIDSINPRPTFLPQTIPASIADRLMRLHGHPFVWWIGQLLLYIVRPQPSLAEDIKQVKRKIGFKSPIVGVHVRRTDKVGTEAAYHALSEYMQYVDEYFNLVAVTKPHVQRRIYLASDDPGVIREARENYPNYEVVCENEFSMTAGLSSRYTESSLRGVILDIHFLSQTDFLVCTFSSQVCRLAYELMQTRFPDASQYFKSLDDIFYYGGQNAHNQRAILSHVAQSPDEISLEVGDVIGIAGNHWNGYSKGTNRRTGASGLYPSYKAVNIITVANFKFDEQFTEVLPV